MHVIASGNPFDGLTLAGPVEPDSPETNEYIETHLDCVDWWIVVFSGPGEIAVFNRELLGEGVIAFGENSYRGDRFERDARSAIKAWEDKRAAEYEAIEVSDLGGQVNVIELRPRMANQPPTEGT